MRVASFGPPLSNLRKKIMTKKENGSSNTVRVRVLIDCAHGQCNDVIEMDADMAESLNGIVDATPEAVAYAESLK